jgi:hypothetical protein
LRNGRPALDADAGWSAAKNDGARPLLVKPVGFDSLLELVKTLDMYWLILKERPELGNP